MARSSINLSGLPDIPKGGIDLDAIVKLATLLNNLSESSAKYGTPGKPGTPVTRRIPGAPENRPAPYTLPGIGPSYGADALIAPEPRVMPGIGPVLPATPDTFLTETVGGTPGTIGLEEQKIRAGLAERGLLSPESVFRKEIKPQDYLKTDSRLWISTSGQLAREKLGEDFFEIDSEKGILEVLKNLRSKVASGGQVASEAMSLYRTLQAKNPFDKTTDDYILELSARDVLLETMPGLGQKFEGRLGDRTKAIRSYAAEKASFMSAWKQISTTSLTREDRRKAAQSIKEFNERFESLDFHTPLNEDTLMKLLR